MAEIVLDVGSNTAGLLLLGIFAMTVIALLHFCADAIEKYAYLKEQRILTASKIKSMQKSAASNGNVNKSEGKPLGVDTFFVYADANDNANKTFQK